MLSKCANPQCFKPFRYLHEGRPFVRTPSGKPDSGKRDNRLVFAWLCRSWATTLTLRFEEGQAGAITPRLVGVDDCSQSP